MPRFRIRSLRTKMLLFVLPPFVLGILTLTALAVSRTTSAAKTSAYEELSAGAHRYANSFDADVRDGSATGRSLAAAAARAETRSALNSHVREVLRRNPQVSLADLAKSTGTPQLARMAESIARGKSGHAETRDPFTGKDVVMSWAPVEHGPWSFVSVAPKAEILAEANRLRTLLLVLGLSVLIVVAITVAVVARRLARPIVQVTEAAEKVARGEVDVTVDASGEDEVGRMAKAFEGTVS